MKKFVLFLAIAMVFYAAPMAQAAPNQTMKTPPVVVSTYHPEINATSFVGRVSVFAVIGTDGKVTGTKIAVTSGSTEADKIAMDAASRWTFKPALDQDNKPMECTKVISISFNMGPK